MTAIRQVGRFELVKLDGLNDWKCTVCESFDACYKRGNVRPKKFKLDGLFILIFT